ncbi:hypothetical protein F5148DRAFT_1245012 [Russula earlei]|uniref:Uncharacterized protein n=1 Tax=Russula earlei TaxID=71964 RepID=A0ACC0TUS7_9AGAM|nr:hypothetical protein F5148DRAFT_1245012 [Russula earlei]
MPLTARCSGFQVLFFHFPLFFSSFLFFCVLASVCDLPVSAGFFNVTPISDRRTRDRPISTHPHQPKPCCHVMASSRAMSRFELCAFSWPAMQTS